MAEEEFSNPSTGGRFPEGTLLGHYRLEWLTARSGTGEVYSAVDTENNRSCSINIINASVSGHAPGLASQLLGKARAACSFRHPALVPVFDTFSIPGCHCIVTAYLEGEFADQMILRGTLPEARVLQIGAQLASLLSEAEKVPLLLFDFTPDTLLFELNGKVRIFHPGISSLIPQLPGQIIAQERQLDNLVPFTAPEILSGTHSPDVRSSIYSLGVLLSFLLCGKAPCQRNNATASMAAVLTSTGNELDRLTQISPGTRALLKKMTESDPEKRPASGKELLQLFTPKRSGRGCLFNAALTAVALLTAAAVGGGIWGWFYYLEHREQSIVDTLEEQGMPRDVPVPPVNADANVKVQARADAKIKAEPQPVKVRRLPVKAASVKIPQGKIRIASVPRPFSWHPSAGQVLAFLRERLMQLENELKQKQVDPRLEQLHKERIEFRQKQILALSARNSQLAAFRNRKMSAEQKKRNAQLRQEIINWGIERNTRTGKNGQKPFPARKLKQHGIDYDMMFQITSSHKAPLWLLMLQGVLLPGMEGAQILAQADVPLLQLHTFQVFPLFRRKDLDEQTARYLVKNLASRYRQNVLFALTPLWKVCTPLLQKAVVEECLLYTPSLPGSVLHNLFANSVVDSQVIRQFLVAEAPLEFAAREGRTPLFEAYLSGSQEAVDQLLAAGADPDRRDAHGRKAVEYKEQGLLKKALLQGDISGAAGALNGGAKPDFIYWNGRTPLVEACLAKNKEMVELLLQKGADINLPSRGNMPPLVHVFPGHIPDIGIFKLLLEKGADTTVSPRPHRPERTFMQELCERYNRNAQAPEFAEVMLRSGKFKTAPANLFAVCRANAVPLFRTLVRYWPQIDTAPYHGLMAEAFRQKMPADIIRTMVERKVPLPPRNELLHLLKNLDLPEITALFPHIPAGLVAQNSGVKKSQPDRKAPERRKKRAPLPHHRGGKGIHIDNPKLKEKAEKALKRRHTRDLEILLKYKIVPVDGIVDFMTLLQYAVKHQAVHMVKILLNYKADPFKYTVWEKGIPICIAAENRDAFLFDLLLQFTPPNNEIHRQVIMTLLKKDIDPFFVKKYLQYNKTELQQLQECFLTFALQEKASVKNIEVLLNWYGSLKNEKHRSVLHQAIASRYGVQLLRALYSRGAFTGAAPSIVKSGRFERRFVLTALQTAQRCRAPFIVIQFLREKGAR